MGYAWPEGMMRADWCLRHRIVCLCQAVMAARLSIPLPAGGGKEKVEEAQDYTRDRAKAAQDRLHRSSDNYPSGGEIRREGRAALLLYTPLPRRPPSLPLSSPTYLLAPQLRTCRCYKLQACPAPLIIEPKTPMLCNHASLLLRPKLLCSSCSRKLVHVVRICS